jgi:hypothetical protein
MPCPACCHYFWKPRVLLTLKLFCTESFAEIDSLSFVKEMVTLHVNAFHFVSQTMTPRYRVDIYLRVHLLPFVIRPANCHSNKFGKREGRGQNLQTYSSLCPKYVYLYENKVSTLRDSSRISVSGIVYVLWSRCFKATGTSQFSNRDSEEIIKRYFVPSPPLLLGHFAKRIIFLLTLSSWRK